jgi:hypothetical protein
MDRPRRPARRPMRVRGGTARRCSGVRHGLATSGPLFPDFASLNPGYLLAGGSGTATTATVTATDESRTGTGRRDRITQFLDDDD